MISDPSPVKKGKPPRRWNPLDIAQQQALLHLLQSRSELALDQDGWAMLQALGLSGADVRRAAAPLVETDLIEIDGTSDVVVWLRITAAGRTAEEQEVPAP